jgi:hypothetical protein
MSNGSRDRHQIKFWRVALMRICRRPGLEGLVSKPRDRSYQGGPSRHWVKVKNRKHPAIYRVVERQQASDEFFTDLRTILLSSVVMVSWSRIGHVQGLLFGTRDVGDFCLT